MLTRLKVSGFKNLVDVDVRFGPFTCVAGANGVGKSNLFDAIRFLRALTNETMVNAALSVRAGGERSADIRSLFHRIGDKFTKEISFEAEMIIPSEGIDDLGQKAKAGITFLRYTVVLAYRVDKGLPSLGSLELIREDLDYIKLSEAWRHLRFPHKASIWRKSAVRGKRTSPFISTGYQGENRIIKLIQEGGGRKTKTVSASNLPRTVLSTVNTIENPTALLARREMQSWQLLQLEPSSIREPDRFITHAGLGPDGSHLAATLYYLAHSHKYTNHTSKDEAAVWFYDKVAARLSELIDDVYSIRIDRDERRRLLTLELTDHNGTVYPAHLLSDGTLRFLALAVLESDPKTSGLICLEEPEDSIYPERIPALLQLLQDIATDVKNQIGPSNPLRQVIVNTHSPAVVNLVPDDSLLVAESKEIVQDGRKLKGACFSWLFDTWRQKAAPDINPVTRDKLLDHFTPLMTEDRHSISQSIKLRHKKVRQVADQPDSQLLLPSFSDME
ncbi:MAG: AAA family ATPase [Deltaproteobacteria bacterium]|nr:AAA family ATPase [Deltaproteobacteria bacterium]